MKQITSKLSRLMQAGLITLFGFSVSAHAGPSQDELNHVTPPEIEWQVSPFGPEMWSLQGDFLSGAHVTYIKFPAGTITPLHIHSADYLGIVIAGTTRHTIRGELESRKILPPGSHWYIPANAEHVSECLPGFECIMAVTQTTSFDFIPLE